MKEIKLFVLILCFPCIALADQTWHDPVTNLDWSFISYGITDTITMNDVMHYCTNEGEHWVVPNIGEVLTLRSHNPPFLVAGVWLVDNQSTPTKSCWDSFLDPEAECVTGGEFDRGILCVQENSIGIRTRWNQFLGAVWKGDYIKALQVAKTISDPQVYGEKSLLDIAVETQNADFVRNLIQTVRPNVNYQNQYGTSPLMRAATILNSEITKLLLNNGADLTAVDRSFNTPLRYLTSTYAVTWPPGVFYSTLKDPNAISQAALQTLRVLANAYGHLDSDAARALYTPALRMAVTQRCLDETHCFDWEPVVNELISLGADLQTPNSGLATFATPSMRQFLCSKKLVDMICDSRVKDSLWLQGHLQDAVTSQPISRAKITVTALDEPNYLKPAFTFTAYLTTNEVNNQFMWFPNNSLVEIRIESPGYQPYVEQYVSVPCSSGEMCGDTRVEGTILMSPLPSH